MKYRVLTNHPVALDSNDHKHAQKSGTANDNSVNLNFNRKLYQLFPDKKIRLMDLGCAGGGAVKSVIDEGHDGIGIEGSDFSLLKKRAEWATIPGNLFTADVTKPFEVQKVILKDILTDVCTWGREKFDVVTAWEMMEHIPESGLPQLIENVKNHLAEGGLWIMSVSIQHDGGFMHVTVKSREWWLDLFDKYGLANQDGLVKHFGNDWVRGPLQGAPESFHLILKGK